VKKVETKSFKRKLSEEIVQINLEVKEWLKSKGFKVNELSSTTVARADKGGHALSVIILRKEKGFTVM
jgi:hypothetical protein